MTRFLAAVSLAALVLAPASSMAAPAAPAVRVTLITSAEVFDSRALIGKKALVLRFQASWCKACASQAAGIQRIHDRYKDKDVVLLAIQVDDPDREARAFLKANRATYPAALDPSLRVANRFGFQRAPYTVVINKKGEITARLDATADEARVAAAIDAALKPLPRSRAPAKAS